MKKILLNLVVFTAFLTASASAWAADKYILVYQKDNQWVAQNDAEPLREMIQAAKTGKHTHFKVILPPSKRDLSVQRLIVIRDILERQLKHSFIIEEVEGVANANTLVITPSHSAK